MSVSSSVIDWFALAVSGAVVRRAIVYSLIVGVALVAINHGTCILTPGSYTATCLWQSILSVMVPYVVTTVSSVQAIRHQNAKIHQ